MHPAAAYYSPLDGSGNLQAVYWHNVNFSRCKSVTAKRQLSRCSRPTAIALSIAILNSPVHFRDGALIPVLLAQRGARGWATGLGNKNILQPGNGSSWPD
jgi:hypothetical protein